MPAPVVPILLGVGLLALLASAGTAKAAAPKPVTPVPGCPPVGTTNTGIAGLPADYRAPIDAAMAVPPNGGEPQALALERLVSQLAACGQTVAAKQVQDRADLVRATSGTPGTFDQLPPGGGPGTGAKIASSPSKQWGYQVVADDNPILITKRFFGNGSITIPGDTAGVGGFRHYRYVELVRNNVATNGEVGEMNNPNGLTVEQNLLRGRIGSVPPYSFARLNAGDVLYIPKSWNAWITPDGYYRSISPASPPFPAT